MQLMKFQANLHRINHIFISHLHGDHYLGLMGLIFTMHLQRRVNDLHIYSHRGLDEIITTQLRYSQSAPAFPIYFHVLEVNRRQIIFEDDFLTIETIPLIHKIRCSGFLFREKQKARRIDKTRLPEGLMIRQIANLKKGDDVLDDEGNLLYRNENLTFAPRRSRSYAYCSDTAFSEAIAEQVRDVNVLYHEATFTEEESLKAKETQHSTGREAAMVARLANVETLLLGHFSARYRDLLPILHEAKAIFENSYLAVEGDEIIIPD
jgi:ribonuclease Z